MCDSMFLGTINNRTVQYLDIKQKPFWVESLPQVNWLLFAIADQYEVELFEQISADCIKHSPVYVCSAGLCALEFDFIFDEDIVADALSKYQQLPYDYEDMISTIHYDFDEGFWFATSAAQHPSRAIDQVICLDLAGTYQTRILELIQLINSGWIPPEPFYDQGTTARIM